MTHLNLTDVWNNGTEGEEVYRQQSLTCLLTSATAAMIALTACALYVIDRGAFPPTPGGSSIWPMVLASSCATLLVMSMLQDELQKLYEALSAGEEQARIDARTDSLTGLGNRKYLFDELQRRSSDNHSDARSALILVDLDNFKRINDTRGHQVGDGLIRAVASRLKLCVPEGTLIRLGGDEFAMLIDVGGDAQLNAVCETLLGAFDSPFVAEDEECFAGGSLGAAWMVHGMAASELLRRADIAMYRAKHARIGYQLFDAEMGDAADRRARLASDLRRAIASSDGLSAQFQGIFSRKGELVGVETLVRWRHPELGLVPPREIISTAEDNRLVNQVGLIVARHACLAAQALPGVKVAMNASPIQLLDDRFRKELETVIASAGLSPGRFQIEVGEAEFVYRAPDMRRALADLLASGFELAVDDFGSSTSSLPYLRKLGVSVLKLDPKVLGNAHEAASIAVMRAKVQLGHALGMTVVCEGVAGEADKAAALQAGCDMIQGYLHGAPEDLAALRMNAGRSRAAA